jgi:hypothetical protein
LFHKADRSHNNKIGQLDLLPTGVEPPAPVCAPVAERFLAASRLDMPRSQSNGLAHDLCEEKADLLRSFSDCFMPTRAASRRSKPVKRSLAGVGAASKRGRHFPSVE